MTTNYHTPIEDGQDNHATTWNTPFGQLDAQITANTADVLVLESEIGVARGGLPDLDTRLDLYDGSRTEVINARGGQASLDARLDLLEVAGSNTFATVASPTATATVTVGTGEADGFRDGAPVGYLVSGDVEYGAVASAAGSTITLTSAPSGTIAAGTIIWMVSPSELAMATAGYTDGSQTPSARIEQAAASAYHPMAWGAVGDGVTADNTVFTAMMTEIGTDRAYILIDRPYKLDTITITGTAPYKNIGLVFQPGGRLVIATGQTVTIRGPLVAGAYKIFDCAGDVQSTPATVGQVSLVAADCPFLLPEWWGAHEDADAAPALLRCIYAAGGHMISLTNFYVIQTPVTVDTTIQSTVRMTGQVRGRTNGIICCIENGFTIQGGQGYDITGGGFTGNYMFRMSTQCYVHIEGVIFRIYGDIVNSNLEIFSVADAGGGSAALELSYLRNCSFDAYKNVTGPTIKHMININATGPLLIDGLNCMYGNWTTTADDPIEYGSCTDYPISVICSNGLLIRNVNYFMALATTKGVRLVANSWLVVEGWWHENLIGGGNPEFELSSYSRGAVQMRSMRFKTSRQQTAGDLVLFEYQQTAGGIIGVSDWDLTQVYWETALDSADIILRIQDTTGTTLASYTAGDLYSALVSGSVHGIAKLNRHEMHVNGHGSVLNNGRCKRIDQQVGTVNAAATFDIYHDPQLMAIANTSGSGCYLLMISARNASNVSAGYCAFIDFCHSAPSVNVTEVAGAANFSVAYNAGTSRFRVTNTSGGNLFNLAYAVIEMTNRTQFTNT